MKHEPIINGALAGCTCKRWPGPAQQDGETPGQFTQRAYAEHCKHAENVRFQQTEQIQMYHPQGALFQ